MLLPPFPCDKGVLGLPEHPGIEAGPVVAHLQRQTLLPLPQDKGDAGSGIPDGIRHKIANHLGQESAVQAEAPGYRPVLQAQPFPPLPAEHVRALVQCRRKLRQGKRPGFRLPVLQPLELAHAFHIALQTADMLPHGGGRGPDLLVLFCLEQLVVAPEHCQGRAQVVGEGGVQAFPLLHLPPHPREAVRQRRPHGLEGRTELPQLVLPLIGQAEVQVIGGNLLRRILQLPQRLPEPIPVEQEGGTQDAERRVDRRSCRGQTSQQRYQPFVPFCKGPGSLCDETPLPQPLALFSGQIIPFPQRRIGLINGVLCQVAGHGRPLAEQKGQQRKENHIQHKAFLQGKIPKPRPHPIHLYPHPQTVSIYVLSVCSAILPRTLRICSDTTELSPSLSYPHIRS